MRDWSDKDIERLNRAERDALAECVLKCPPTYIRAHARYAQGNKITRTGREVDSQRQRLYDSESAVFGVRFNQTVFTSVEECQSYADRITSSAWFRRRFGDISVTIKPGRGCVRALAHTSSRTIKLPKWARQKWVIIHELTHILAPKPHGSHGRLFCAIYLDLLDHFLGSDKASALKAEMKKRNVKYSPRRSVPEVDSRHKAA